MSDIQRYGEEFQRASKNGLDASVRSFSEMSKGFEAIRTTMMDYTRNHLGRHPRLCAVGGRKVG